ncbi:metal-dependent phosphohydrolase [Mycolicibacterium litorale]|uniref:Metal-dependent phosphohydrolase n=1 Tax=Mycolicibacterium litorale TaxID=758802 RepID=A0A6S6P4U1_9MYCO|nr:HD domain-containing phosphohydrolase [Mycolicibacterium litorale]BCI51680.1 metal-dependent phosphohydrolase [Mycolicibacterium litorale]
MTTAHNQLVTTRPQAAGLPTRAEVLAALSVAIDLGLGQPAEHMLRSALIATRLADRLGLTRAQRDCVYYCTLIMWIGCHADSHEYARWFGDDIAVRRASYLVDWSGLPYQRFLLTNVRHGEPLLQRLRTVTALYADARGHISRLIHSHCTSAALLAGRIGLDGDVQRVLGFTFERFDGGGLPDGAAGEAIPLEMRVAQFADMVEVHQRGYGVEGAVAMARSRRGGQFDPAIVDAFAADPEPVLAVPMTGDVWTTALRQAPDRNTRLDASGLDALLIALGDFVDLKCPFTTGHSRAVATLAAEAATAVGLDADAVALTRRAGHVHDIGRIGVSNQVWSKPSALSMAEFERMRLHPYLTERILRQVPGLAHVASVAANHHERLDGSGYPRGLGARELTMLDRVLAAAVSYHAACEPRPYRAAMTPGDAARRVRERVRDGGLDPVAAEAVLHAAGQSSRPTPRSGGLTAREAEVLCLVAQGATNREIATKLVISEKTARNHVERTYAKIGVSNRVAASLYALEHGLLGRPT